MTLFVEKVPNDIFMVLARNDLGAGSGLIVLTL